MEISWLIDLQEIVDLNSMLYSSQFNVNCLFGFDKVYPYSET